MPQMIACYIYQNLYNPTLSYNCDSKIVPDINCYVRMINSVATQRHLKFAVLVIPTKTKLVYQKYWFQIIWSIVFTNKFCLLRLCRSFCGCPQCGAAPYRDCFLDLRLFNSPDLRRLGLCYCCQAWTLETVLGGNTALTRWWTARSIDADVKR